MRGWDAVEWRPLLASLNSLSMRYVTGHGVAGLRRELVAAEPGVAVVRRFSDAVAFDSLDDASELQAAGDSVLRLYFAQWLVSDGLFIDLRPARFAASDTGELQFRPNGLWIQLGAEFREGMLALYRSFYSDDSTAFEDSLRQMGMLREGLSASAESELKELLHAHFGIEQRAQRFSLDAFKASFDQLFEFFVGNDYRLHSDFVFVGFYLITLYLTLEQGGQAHNVREICSDVLLDE
ncbi:MAG: hypothetical protein AAFN78_09325 [Pseudomonadota bacterium]